MTATTPTSTATATGEPRPTTSGRFEAPDGIRLRPTRSRIRMPWIVVGVLLVVGSGLTFAVWADGAAGRTDVLALARDVEPGHTLLPEDLTSVGVGSDAPLNVIRPDELEEVVGKTVLARLGSGTLLADDVLTAGPLVDEGRALVAVSIGAEAAPTGDLGPGDAVMAVETPGDIPADPEAALLLPRVWAATVFSVTDVDTFDGTTVTVASLEVDPFSAAEIAAAAAADRIRLVAVNSVEDVPPELLLGRLTGPPESTPPPEAAPETAADTEGAPR